jgi:predicted DNA-binding ribbon-helix-helix protein
MARKCQLGEDRIATAVRLPSSVHRELHQAAADRDVSVNLLVTKAVSRYLQELRPIDEVAAP